MIGAGTMRAERYGRMVSDPQLRAYRERTGLTHDPLGVIVSNRLELPWDAGLFTDGGGRVVIFTASDEEPPETATPVTLVRHPDGVELYRALEWLLTERGIRSVLCEGGPTLHGRLREGGLADELFLTIAPKIAGGEAPRVLEGALPDVDEVELSWLLESQGELFGRYRGITAGPGGAESRPRRGRFHPWTSTPRPRSNPSSSASRRSWTSTSIRSRRRRSERSTRRSSRVRPIPRSWPGSGPPPGNRVSGTCSCRTPSTAPASATGNTGSS